MTLTVIKDGRSGNTASVDSTGRVLALATSIANIVQKNIEGQVYTIPSGVINLTSANRSEIMYFKNTDTVNWVVESFEAAFGVSDGSGDILAYFTRRAEDGTIITAGIPVLPANLNSGSPKPLNAIALLGGEGFTVTGGEEFVEIQPQIMPSRQFLPSSLVLAPGNSFAIGIQPPPGNTSMNVTFDVTLYRNV